MSRTSDVRPGQPASQAAVRNVKQAPLQDNGPVAPIMPFLVVVLNQALGTSCERVVGVVDDEATARMAVQERKDDSELSNQSDEAAGFKAIAIIDRKELAHILRMMDLPEPDL
jgi:hypothetical protein